MPTRHGPHLPSPLDPPRIQIASYDFAVFSDLTGEHADATTIVVSDDAYCLPPSHARDPRIVGEWRAGERVNLVGSTYFSCNYVFCCYFLV